MNTARQIPEPPGRAGDPLARVDTPALLLEHGVFERNVARMAARARQGGVRLRPHAKAHKSIAIAQAQLRAGAVGLCCQKVSEAEVFVQAGVPDVLVSNEVVGADKLRRLAVLARASRIGLCVDHPDQITPLAEAARAQSSRIDVMIELDVGQGRCGVPGVDDALALARLIDRHAPQLRLIGLQAYHGGAQHLRTASERGTVIGRAAALASQVRDALRAAGHHCERITGGGTGSFVHELASGVYDEIQPGSYVLMDADYAANQPDPGELGFEQALFLLATVISVHPGRAVLDAGLKAMCAESGVPRCAEPGWCSVNISDEHLVIAPEPRSQQQGRVLEVGDRVRVVPSHCDPTVNLHDWLLVVEGDQVRDCWAVDARGRVF